MAQFVCALCGTEMVYLGVNDGGGLYGTSLCDEWECPICDYIEEGHCIDLDDDPYEDESQE